MASNSNDIFTTKVKPVMDRVKEDLQRKQADELKAHGTSMASLMAGSVGPDGGIGATATVQQNLHTIGKWNSKTTEDYVNMVKTELKKQGIKVDSVMEKRMIDYLIAQKIPHSSAEYLLKKAGEGSLFYIPHRASQSALDDHVRKEAENRYNPSLAEEVAGHITAWAGNAATTFGLGGFFGQLAIDATVEGTDSIAPGQQEAWKKQQREKAKKDLEEARKKPVTKYPQWMLSQMNIKTLDTATDKQLTIALNWAVSNRRNYEHKVADALDSGSRTISYNGKELSLNDAYIREQQYALFLKAIKSEQAEREQAREAEKAQAIAPAANTYVTQSTDNNQQAEQQTAQQNTVNSQPSMQNNQQSTGDYSGWNNLLDSVGLAGIGDTFNHLGLTLATLPDMLLGVFTGKTKSMGMNSGTMIPLAALVCGTFVKNPLLKIPLLLYGGLNILNKSGQEALTDYRPKQDAVRYRQYADEALDKRIKNPQIEGSVMLLDIDNTPRIVNLPQQVIDAYQRGAVPLNTLANRILAKYDEQAVNNRQQTETVSERYEQSREREQVRGIR